MPDEPSAENLMDGIARGEEAAFRELVRLHGRYLFGIAATLTRDAGEAEDAVQETWTALISAAKRFRGDASPRTFLVALLVRQCALIRRKRRGWLRLVRSPETPSPTLAGEAGRIDARLDLAALLERLSPEHREVIVMRELEQMSYDAMADALGVPRGTIESRLHRARQQLRELWNH